MWDFIYWTPNINIFVTRWGRGQETYGGRSFSYGNHGNAFVSGLQLMIRNIWKRPHVQTFRCTGPGTNKTFQIFQSYLPMIYGILYPPGFPGNWWWYAKGWCNVCLQCNQHAAFVVPMDVLMNDILRNQWKFTGYVTSDCWAITISSTIIKHIRCDCIRYWCLQYMGQMWSVVMLCTKHYWITVKSGTIKNHNSMCRLNGYSASGSGFWACLILPWSELCKDVKLNWSRLHTKAHALKIAQQYCVIEKCNSTLPLKDWRKS